MKPEWKQSAFALGVYYLDADDHICGQVYRSGFYWRWIGRDCEGLAAGYSANADDAKAEVERRCVHA